MNFLSKVKKKKLPDLPIDSFDYKIYLILSSKQKDFATAYGYILSYYCIRLKSFPACSIIFMDYLFSKLKIYRIILFS